jgi:hypothetical protein
LGNEDFSLINLNRKKSQGWSPVRKSMNFKKVKFPYIMDLKTYGHLESDNKVEYLAKNALTFVYKDLKSALEMSSKRNVFLKLISTS